MYEAHEAPLTHQDVQRQERHLLCPVHSSGIADVGSPAGQEQEPQQELYGSPSC